MDYLTLSAVFGILSFIFYMQAAYLEPPVWWQMMQAMQTMQPIQQMQQLPNQQLPANQQPNQQLPHDPKMDVYNKISVMCKASSAYCFILAIIFFILHIRIKNRLSKEE